MNFLIIKNFFYEQKLQKQQLLKNNNQNVKNFKKCCTKNRLAYQEKNSQNIYNNEQINYEEENIILSPKLKILSKIILRIL